MALSRKYIEFDITGDNLKVGVPVGYEADFSADSSFKEIRSSISTFNSLDENQSNKIYYNINGESVWSLFPYGQEGVTFNDSYKIRVETNPIDTGYVLIESSGVLNKVRSDFNGIISSSNIFPANTSSEALGIEVNNEECFILTEDNIVVTNYNDSTLNKRNLPLLNERALAISLDSARGTFWQINSDSIYLRNLFGEKLFTVSLPNIDAEVSSSSSMSSGSSSSSSSSKSVSSDSSEQTNIYDVVVTNGPAELNGNYIAADPADYGNPWSYYFGPYIPDYPNTSPDGNSGPFDPFYVREDGLAYIGRGWATPASRLSLTSDGYVWEMGPLPWSLLDFTGKYFSYQKLSDDVTYEFIPGVVMQYNSTSPLYSTDTWISYADIIAWEEDFFPLIYALAAPNTEPPPASLVCTS